MEAKSSLAQVHNKGYIHEGLIIKKTPRYTLYDCFEEPTQPPHELTSYVTGSTCSNIFTSLSCSYPGNPTSPPTPPPPLRADSRHFVTSNIVSAFSFPFFSHATICKLPARTRRGHGGEVISFRKFGCEAALAGTICTICTYNTALSGPILHRAPRL